MENIEELEKLKGMYEGALNRLQEYSISENKAINMPISSVGFIQGRLINTKEVFVCLSPELTLKTTTQACQDMISRKIADLNLELQAYKKPDKTIDEIFQKLKILENEENSTPCLGQIVEKPQEPMVIKEKNFDTESVKKVRFEDVKNLETIHEEVLETEPKTKVSKFKQEMANKRRG